MKKFIIVMISIILAGCSAQSNTSNNEETTTTTTTTTTQIVTTTTSAESNYENLVADLVGTWHINEHQTVTFYDDGTALITDDGSGRLDFKAGEYAATYYYTDDGKFNMYFTNAFVCEIVSAWYYKVFIDDDGNLVFDDGYSPTDIVMYK